MMRAANADELDESMREWVDPCNNFVFVDVHGEIGYLNRGKVPIRAQRNAWLPAPGWDGQHEWQGYIPFEDLARSRNPENGFIVTANNRIVDKDYPYYISLDSAPDYRARRIFQRLRDMEEATVADMAAVHADRVSIPAQIFQPIVAEAEHLDGPSGKAKELLASWDCSMDADAVAPAIFAAFHVKLTRLVIEHLVGPLADEMMGAQGRGAPNHLRHLSTRMNTAAENRDAAMLPPGSTWQSRRREGAVPRRGAAAARPRPGHEAGGPGEGSIGRVRCTPSLPPFPTWQSFSTPRRCRWEGAWTPPRRAAIRSADRSPSRERRWRATSSTPPTGMSPVGSCPSERLGTPAALTTRIRPRPGAGSSSYPCSTAGPEYGPRPSSSRLSDRASGLSSPALSQWGPLSISPCER